MRAYSLASRLLLLCSACVNFGFGLAKEPGRNYGDVTVTLSTVKTDFSADEDVLVNVTLSNIEAQKPGRILDWVNPCDSNDQYSGMPKDMSFFKISTNGGNVAKYIGALIKRGRPVAKNYKVLLPGEQISCTVNLGEFYQFAAKSDDDTYDIQYLVSGMQLSGPINDGISLESIQSNPLKVKVAARHIPRHLEGSNLRGLQSGSNWFRGCTTSRQNSIRDARSQAVTAAKDATDCIASVSGSGRTRYEEWFGQFSSSRHKELKSGYDAIYARLKDASITFDCSCTSSSFAYVFPNRPYEIFLCNAFWSAPATGTDSKMGTIVHEMSHFTATADTDDNAYGQSACRNLAKSDPARAINNGDSHEYMAENTPSLSCAPRPTPPPAPRPTPPPAPSCMSGNTRVGVLSSTESLNVEQKYKAVRELNMGDTIQGLNESMNPVACTVEAIGYFGNGPTYGNYTGDHFILNTADQVVMPNGKTGNMEVVDKYAVLTSCPVGLDESGVGFTAVDADFLGHKALSWLDYIDIHRAIVDIVHEVGPFVFSPSTYTSMEQVKQYTNKLYKTMLKCARDSRTCNAFEKAAKDLVENTLTEEAKTKINTVFNNFGKPNMPGSIAAVVSKGQSLFV